MGRLVKNPVAVGVVGNEGIVLPAGPTTDRSPAPATGTIRFNTETQVIEVFNGAEFKNVSSQGTATVTKDTFTGDGSTVAYTMSLEPVADQNIIVFVGNVFQIAGTNYTTSGTTITFTSPPPDTHTIVVLHGFDSTETS